MYSTYNMMYWYMYIILHNGFEQFILVSIIVGWEWPKRAQTRTESSIPAPYLEVKVVISFSGQMLQVLWDDFISQFTN